MGLMINKKVTEYFIRETIEEKVWRDDLYDGRCALPFSDYTFEKKEVERKISQSQYVRYRKEGKFVFAKRVPVSFSVDELIKGLNRELKELDGRDTVGYLKRRIKKSIELNGLYKLKLEDIHKELNNIDSSMYSDKYFEVKHKSIHDLDCKIGDLNTYISYLQEKLTHATHAKDIKRLQYEKKKLLEEKAKAMEKFNTDLLKIEEELSKLSSPTV